MQNFFGLIEQKYNFLLHEMQLIFGRSFILTGWLKLLEKLMLIAQKQSDVLLR